MKKVLAVLLAPLLAPLFIILAGTVFIRSLLKPIHLDGDIHTTARMVSDLIRVPLDLSGGGREAVKVAVTAIRDAK
jgi:hypothetical protein